LSEDVVIQHQQRIDDDLLTSYITEAQQLKLATREEFENFIAKSHKTWGDDLAPLLTEKLDELFGVAKAEIKEEIDNFLPKLSKILDKKISYDYVQRILIFLVGFSAYTKEPLNLFLKGPTSSGKTYLTTTVLDLFPPEDVWFLGGMSPKALIHEYGTKEIIETSENGKVKKEELHIVDLRNKILVFLETPNRETLNILKPILSHDKEEIKFKIVTGTSKKKHVTKTAIIQGWPATIFCTTRTRTDTELSTRSLMATPDLTPKKIRGTVSIIFDDAVDPTSREINVKDRNWIRKFLLDKKEELKKLSRKVKKEEYFNVLREAVLKIPYKQVRLARDLKKLISLIDVMAFLHSANRRKTEKNEVIANEYDIVTACFIYDCIREPTELGLPAPVLDFFEKVYLPLQQILPEGVNKLQLMEKYRKVYHVPISEQWLRKNFLNPLCEEVGWLAKDRDPNDSRQIIFVPGYEKNPLEVDRFFYTRAFIDGHFLSGKLKINTTDTNDTNNTIFFNIYNKKNGTNVKNQISKSSLGAENLINLYLNIMPGKNADNEHSRGNISTNIFYKINKNLSEIFRENFSQFLHFYTKTHPDTIIFSPPSDNTFEQSSLGFSERKVPQEMKAMKEFKLLGLKPREKILRIIEMHTKSGKPVSLATLKIECQDVNIPVEVLRKELEQFLRGGKIIEPSPGKYMII